MQYSKLIHLCALRHNMFTCWPPIFCCLNPVPSHPLSLLLLRLFLTRDGGGRSVARTTAWQLYPFARPGSSILALSDGSAALLCLSIRHHREWGMCGSDLSFRTLFAFSHQPKNKGLVSKSVATVVGVELFKAASQEGGRFYDQFTYSCIPD